MYKKIDLDKLIIYDIETLVNCIVVCCRDFKSGKKKEYVLFDNMKYQDQPKDLYLFMKNCIRNNYTFVGFNNVGFDAQVLEYYYDLCSEEQDPLYDFDLNHVIKVTYDKSQEIINLPREEAFKHLIPEDQLFSPQIDVFKQLHYDRKKTSLKWVQFSMRYPNIEEMPFAHDDVITIDDIDSLVEYCWNDVDSTYEFFLKVKYETDTRLSLAKQFGVEITNAAEPRMVREIFATFLTKQMKVSYKELKAMRTIRKNVALKDVIFPYIKFRTPELKAVLDLFNKQVINTTPYAKGDDTTFAHSFQFGGMKVDVGLGGIHAFGNAGVHEHKEDEVIEDADGKSFYPFLAIVNNLRPEHLGDAFNVVYPMMYDERLKYDKKDPRNYIFKIILNSAYGLSKEINSYLYDPKFTYAITVNGQLSLLMLAEALYMSVPGISFIQMNTDGLTYKYNKEHTDVVRRICEWWQKTTRIELEYAYYDKMVFRDVNNYMAIDTKGIVKKKGIFEIDMAFNKNPSSLIIPKALEQFFVNNLTPEQYITRPDHSIFDFCNGVKRTHDFKLNLVKHLTSGELVEEQQKVTRYIISRPDQRSGLLVKDYKDGRRISVEANKLVMTLNKINMDHTDAIHYPVDYDDYIKETRKVIEVIKPSTTQQTLF